MTKSLIAFRSCFTATKLDPLSALCQPVSVSGCVHSAPERGFRSSDYGNQQYYAFLTGANVNLTDGNMYPFPPDFLFGPKWVRLAPYETRTSVINHEIPSDAPTGVYVYNGEAGRKPWTVWYEDHFKFAVIPSS